MKISRLQRDITLNQGTSRLHSESQNFREKTKGAYDNNRGYSANYNGSFTGKSEAAVKVAKKGGIFASKWFNDFLAYTDKHNVATSALVALGLAGVMRPATILALPGKKDKEDKIYASGHSMASAILGFVASVIITSPLDGAVQRLFDGNGYAIDGKKKIIKDKNGTPKILSKTLVRLAEKEEKLAPLANLRDEITGKIVNKRARYLHKSVKAIRESLKTLVKNLPDIIIAIPRSILTIALIPPILKYVFGVEKKKKPEQTEAPKDINNMTTPTNMDFIDKPAFKEFKGGVQ